MAPRGIRNNNPGNIEYGRFARSMGATGHDGRFAKFPTPEAGIRAITALQQKYENSGRETVYQRISRWAPASDNNNVAAYSAAVARRMGIDVNTPFSINDPVLGPAFIDGMIAHENGYQPYTSTQIQTGHLTAAGRYDPLTGQLAYTGGGDVPQTMAQIAAQSEQPYDWEAGGGVGGNPNLRADSVDNILQSIAATTPQVQTPPSEQPTMASFAPDDFMVPPGQDVDELTRVGPEMPTPPARPFRSMVTGRPETPVGALPAARLSTTVATPPERPVGAFPRSMGTEPPVAGGARPAGPVGRLPVSVPEPHLRPSPAEQPSQPVVAGPPDRPVGELPEQRVPGTLFASPEYTMATRGPETPDPTQIAMQPPVSSATTMAARPPQTDPVVQANITQPIQQTHRPVTPPRQPQQAAPQTMATSAPRQAGSWFDREFVNLIARGRNGGASFVGSGRGGVNPAGYVYQTGTGLGGQPALQWTGTGGRTVTVVENPTGVGYFTGYS